MPSWNADNMSIVAGRAPINLSTFSTQYPPCWQDKWPSFWRKKYRYAFGLVFTNSPQTGRHSLSTPKMRLSPFCSHNRPLQHFVLHQTQCLLDLFWVCFYFQGGKHQSYVCISLCAHFRHGSGALLFNVYSCSECAVFTVGLLSSWNAPPPERQDKP